MCSKDIYPWLMNPNTVNQKAPPLGITLLKFKVVSFTVIQLYHLKQIRVRVPTLQVVGLGDGRLP